MRVTTPGRVRRRGRRRAVVVTALVGVVLASGLVYVMVRFAASAPDQADLGPRVFNVGRAERLAGRIDEDGPLLFQDALGRGREIYVQHVGGEDEDGWLAFEAYGPASPHQPDCVLVWVGEADAFRDPCGAATYPPDGTGLVHYRAAVEDGTVVVDLNRPRD